MDPTARAVVCVCLWLFVGQVRGSHIPPKMNRTIQNLLLHSYKISPRERFNGKPVFSKEPLSGKMEARKLFMGGILETYDKMLNQMLETVPTVSPETAVSPQSTAFGTTLHTGTASKAGSHNTVRKELSYILTMVHSLKHNYYQEQERLLTGLKSLQEVKTEDIVVQSKALGELPWLYEEASSLVNNGRAQRRRRRRQTQRAKKRAKDGKQQKN